MIDHKTTIFSIQEYIIALVFRKNGLYLSIDVTVLICSI